jgi:hypothetical protein
VRCPAGKNEQRLGVWWKEKRRGRERLSGVIYREREPTDMRAWPRKTNI